jgi:hypothetical protein
MTDDINNNDVMPSSSKNMKLSNLLGGILENQDTIANELISSLTLIRVMTI